MELAFIVWMIGVLPALGSGMVFVGAVVAYLASSGYIFSILGGADKKYTKIAKYLIPVGVFVWLVGALIPDKQTAYAMAAAYGVQTVVENPKAQELASDGVDVLKALMSKAKKELEKEEK